MRYVLLSIYVCLVIFTSCKRNEDEPAPHGNAAEKRVLLFSVTEGFRHESIDAGVNMFRQNAGGWGIELYHSSHAGILAKDSVGLFDVVVLLNTTGNWMNDAEQAGLKDYVLNGGTVLGIHAATDAEYDWPWYGDMLGARFKNHPEIQPANCIVITGGHIAVRGLPQQWQRTDEWYNFSNLLPGNEVLITVDENTYSGGEHGTIHPVSWYRQVGKGRVFYTAMGHTVESYSEPLFIQHIGNALKWLMG